MPKRKREEEEEDGSKNKIKYKGVTKTKSGKYKAQLKIDGKMHYPGRFDTAKEAAQAYDYAVIQAGRPTSKLNFLDQVPKNYKPKMKKLSSGNTTGYRGVIKRENMFQSRIYVDSKLRNVGTYRTKREAAIAWDLAAVQTKRPKCHLNFPDFDYASMIKKKKMMKNSSSSSSRSGGSSGGSGGGGDDDGQKLREFALLIENLG